MSSLDQAGQPALNLTEEEIDDILFFSRAGQVEELRQTVEEAVKRAESTHAKQVLGIAKNESGNTALHYCCANGHRDVLDYLLQLSDLPLLLKQNASGNTPLHWAALNGHVEIVKQLVEAIDSAAESSTAVPTAQRDQGERIANGSATDKSDLSFKTADLSLSSPTPPVNGTASSSAPEATTADSADSAPAPPVWDIRNAAGRGPMSEAQMNGKEEVVTWLLERMVVGSNQQQKQEREQEQVAGEDGAAEENVSVQVQTAAADALESASGL